MDLETEDFPTQPWRQPETFECLPFAIEAFSNFVIISMKFLLKFAFWMKNESFVLYFNAKLKQKTTSNKYKKIKAKASKRKITFDQKHHVIFWQFKMVSIHCQASYTDSNCSKKRRTTCWQLFCASLDNGQKMTYRNMACFQAIYLNIQSIYYCIARENVYKF